MLEAQLAWRRNGGTATSGNQALALRIVAVDLDKLEHTLIDASDAGSRTRLGLKAAKLTYATNERPMLLMGDAHGPPCIQRNAIVAHLNLATAAVGLVALRDPYEAHLKAIPASTIASIDAMVAAAHYADDDQPHAREATTPWHVRSVWRRDDVVRQPLLHNPYYRDGARISSRSDIDTESMAMRWAQHGVMCVRDICCADGSTLLTAEQFATAHAALAPDLWAYREILSVMPPQWKEALTGGHRQRAKQLETWWLAPDGSYWRQWIEHATDDDPCKWLVGRYRRERNSPLLAADGDPIESGRIPNGATECAVAARPQPVKQLPRQALDSAWGSGPPAHVRAARRAIFTHVVYGTCRETAHAPLDELTMQPGGLLQRHPVRVSVMESHHLRDMLGTVTPILPRAWDHTDANAHFAHLYDGLPPERFVAALRRAFADARFHAIPPHIQDVLYKILVSGYRIGGVKRRGADAMCQRCGDEHAVESLEHAFATCPHVAALWHAVIKRWNLATCQELDHTDLRVTMLGDRGEQAHALSHGLWRMVHAATLWVIHFTAKRAREQRSATDEQRTTHKMLAHVRKTLQSMVTAAWLVRGQGAQLQWNAWREEGWIVVGAGHRRAVARVLDGGYAPERHGGFDGGDSSAPHATQQATQMAAVQQPPWHSRADPQGINGAARTTTGRSPRSQHDASSSTTHDAASNPTAQHQRCRPVAVPCNPLDLTHDCACSHDHVVDLHTTRLRRCSCQHSTLCSTSSSSTVLTPDARCDDMQPYQSCEQADSTHASTQEHDQLPMRWQLYVDGAWVPPDEEGKRPEGESPDAGYGVAELTICNSNADHTADDPAVPLTQITANSATNMADCMHGKVSWSLSGCVQTDPKEHDYVGAVGHTNNTGELSAIYWAIQRALQRPAQRGREEIHSDSLYGINMTTGVWVPKVPRTREMICLLRRSWRLLQRRRPREVRLRHVRSHIKVPGNEAADWLADTGRGGGNGARGDSAMARQLAARHAARRGGG